MKDAKGIIRNFTKEVWNQKRVDLIPHYISDSYIVHTLGKGGEVRGISGVKNNILNCHLRYNNFNIKIKKMVQEKNLVSSWITLKNGNKMMNELIIHKVSGGKIVEAWSIGGEWLTDKK